MDVIGLTEKKLHLNTHEALKYLQNMITVAEPPKVTPVTSVTSVTPCYSEDFEQMQSSLLSSSIARKYLESRNLNRDLLQVGYNAFKDSKFNYLRGCITFALRDKKGNVVSMYGRSVRDNDKAKHYYTADRKGLYPSYPPAETRKLIITESIIDTATLMQLKIENGELKNFELLAAYGTNGITNEHINCLSGLPNLEEIVLWFDGDQAGRKATAKYSKELQEFLPNITISHVETIEDEDINSLSVSHEQEIFIHLLQNRKPFVERLDTQIEILDTQLQTETLQPKPVNNKPAEALRQLQISNPYKITYSTAVANYFVKGGLPKALDSMKVTLEIEHPETGRKSRTKPDLYEDRQVEKVSREAGEKLGIRADLIEQDLNCLTDLLDTYREQQTMSADNKEESKPIVTAEQQEKCIAFLKQKNLIKHFNKLIEQAGITGEDNNRIFLFVIASSYKMPDTLHALIQGSSGSGKTYLSRQITDLMPGEDVIRLTRVTESSFYNYGEYEIQYKLIVLEDVDGLKEEAEYAFR